VRRHLNDAGYYHVQRGKKRKYTKDQREERVAFTDWVNGMIGMSEKTCYRCTFSGCFAQGSRGTQGHSFT